MLQPHIPQERIIPFLIQKQLAAPPESRIDLAVLVQIGRVRPGTVAGVEVEDGTFADIDEEADAVVASARLVSWVIIEEEEEEVESKSGRRYSHF